LQLVLVRDREKQQTNKESKQVQIRFQLLQDNLTRKQVEYNTTIIRDITSFAKNILIDPEILVIKASFQV
jgi:hypothetical protein